MIVTAADIVEIVHVRNIDAGHYTDAVIEAAQLKYVRDNLDDDTYSGLKTDSDLLAIAKNVVAFGAAVDVFEGIRIATTDRGMVQMLGDGVTPAPEDAWRLKKELALRRDFWIKEMTDYAGNDELSTSKQVAYYSEVKRVNHV